MSRVRKLEGMHFAYPVAAVWDALLEVLSSDRTYRAVMGYGLCIPGALFEEYELILASVGGGLELPWRGIGICRWAGLGREEA